MPRSQTERSQKRDQLRKTRRQSEQRRRIFTIIAVAVVAVGLAALFIWPFIRPAYTGFARPQAKDNAAGDVNAPVRVEEFSDFQCPYCAKWSLEEEEAFLEKYVATGKVYFIYTPFSFLGNESIRAAEASYCALDQGRFWDYHDILFANQAAENSGAYSDDRLKEFAGELKLDTQAFNSCFDGGKFTQRVLDNITYGREKGIKATPYFLVNDTQVVDSTQLEKAVEDALAAKK